MTNSTYGQYHINYIIFSEKIKRYIGYKNEGSKSLCSIVNTIATSFIPYASQSIIFVVAYSIETSKRIVKMIACYFEHDLE